MVLGRQVACCLQEATSATSSNSSYRSLTCMKCPVDRLASQPLGTMRAGPKQSGDPVDQYVVLIDDDEDLRASIADLVESCGKRCLAVGSLAELVDHRAAALACELAIVDVNLGAAKPSGIDAYEWLRGEGFDGRIVFLTGHAPSHPLVSR